MNGYALQTDELKYVVIAKRTKKTDILVVVNILFGMGEP